jgi:hypothetical protein
VHDQELTVNNPVVIREQNADEEAQEREPEPATKERTMTVLEVDCAVSTHCSWHQCIKKMSLLSSKQEHLDNGL